MRRKPNQLINQPLIVLGWVQLRRCYIATHDQSGVDLWLARRRRHWTPSVVVPVLPHRVPAVLTPYAISVVIGFCGTGLLSLILQTHQYITRPIPLDLDNWRVGSVLPTWMCGAAVPCSYQVLALPDFQLRFASISWLVSNPSTVLTKGASDQASGWPGEDRCPSVVYGVLQLRDWRLR